MFRIIEATAGTNYALSNGTLIFNPGELTATYYSSIKDAGYVAEFRLLIDTVATVSTNLAWDTDPLATFSDDDTLRFSGREIPGLISIQIRTSSDNVTWSDFEDWISADYNCRYYQVKMTITRASTDINVSVTSLVIKADLPDIDETGTATVSVAGSGVAITFTKTFHEIPGVNIDIISGSGIVHQFTVAPSTTGCTVKLYDLSAVAQTGNIRYHAHGI